MYSSAAEHPTFNRLVVGSIPTTCIIHNVPGSLVVKQRIENPLILVRFQSWGIHRMYIHCRGYSSMAEYWFVVPTVMGSSPITHHNVLRLVVRTSFFHDEYMGSIPIGRIHLLALLAQWQSNDLLSHLSWVRSPYSGYTAFLLLTSIPR
jgi:hypothetical protein